MKFSITIIDYNMSNLHSVVSAFEYNNFTAKISSEKNDIVNCDCLILPGVGSFGVAMDNLKKTKIIDYIYEFVSKDKPLICICLGMQLLFEESYENGLNSGLKILKGTVKKFNTDNVKYPIPHTGWNNIELNFEKNNKLYKNMNQNEQMYFVHSYYVDPEDKGIISSFTNYANINFCSSINYKNIYGFQFHPEKSGKKGLNIYRNIEELI